MKKPTKRPEMPEARRFSFTRERVRSLTTLELRWVLGGDGARVPTTIICTTTADTCEGLR